MTSKPWLRHRIEGKHRRLQAGVEAFIPAEDEGIPERSAVAGR
jgi:hypothetical protein